MKKIAMYVSAFLSAVLVGNVLRVYSFFHDSAAMEKMEYNQFFLESVITSFGVVILLAFLLERKKQDSED